MTILRKKLGRENKCLANAKRPCDCSVRPASMHVDVSCNNGVGQFKPIFQVEGNTFDPFGYFIAE